MSAIKANRFDAVFSDIVMPGPLNGIDLAQKIRAFENGPPVILTTGYSDEAQKAIDAGITIIFKPYTIQELEKAIELARRPA